MSWVITDDGWGVDEDSFAVADDQGDCPVCCGSNCCYLGCEIVSCDTPGAMEVPNCDPCELDFCNHWPDPPIDNDDHASSLSADGLDIGSSGPNAGETFTLYPYELEGLTLTADWSMSGAADVPNNQGVTVHTSKVTFGIAGLSITINNFASARSGIGGGGIFPASSSSSLGISHSVVTSNSDFTAFAPIYGSSQGGNGFTGETIHHACNGGVAAATSASGGGSATTTVTLSNVRIGSGVGDNCELSYDYSITTSGSTSGGAPTIQTVNTGCETVILDLESGTDDTEAAGVATSGVTKCQTVGVSISQEISVAPSSTIFTRNALQSQSDVSLSFPTVAQPTDPPRCLSSPVACCINGVCSDIDAAACASAGGTVVAGPCAGDLDNGAVPVNCLTAPPLAQSFTTGSPGSTLRRITDLLGIDRG